MTKQKQATLLEFNKVATKEELNHIINLLRKEVGDWRNNGYKNTTRVTQTLLKYWFKNPQRKITQSLFFAQQEAVETAIWLNEVAERTNPEKIYLPSLKIHRG